MFIFSADKLLLLHLHSTHRNIKAITRRESTACSEQVLFPDFNKNALLPEGQPVTLEFIPEQSPEYGFRCQMGMPRGKLIVE